MTEYRKCPKCGAQNAPTAGFCSQCGTSLQDVQPTVVQPAASPTSPPPPAPKGGGNKNLALIAVVLVLLALFAGGFFFFLESEKSADAERERMEELERKQEALAEKNRELELKNAKIEAANEAREQAEAEAKEKAAQQQKAAAAAAAKKPAPKAPAGYTYGHIIREGGYTNIRVAPNGGVARKIKDGTAVYYVTNWGDWYEVYDLSLNYMGYVHRTKLVAGN